MAGEWATAELSPRADADASAAAVRNVVADQLRLSPSPHAAIEDLPRALDLLEWLERRRRGEIA